MRATLPLLTALWCLSACGSEPPPSPGGTWDSATGPSDPSGTGTPPEQSETEPLGLRVQITAPASGATFAEGSSVALISETTDSTGAEVKATVLWSAPDWSGQGLSLTATDLPVGSYEIVATAALAGEVAEDSIQITITELEEVEYSGLLHMETELEIDGLGSFDYPCEHRDLRWTLQGQAFTGSGECEVDYSFGDETYRFDVDGSISGSSVSGTMRMEDSSEVLLFDGSYDPVSGHIEASYDETWSNSDGSLRLYGSLEGDPLP